MGAFRRTWGTSVPPQNERFQPKPSSEGRTGAALAVLAELGVCTAEKGPGRKNVKPQSAAKRLALLPPRPRSAERANSCGSTSREEHSQKHAPFMQKK